MQNILNKWGGAVSINGTDYDNISDVDFKSITGTFRILLTPHKEKPVQKAVEAPTAKEITQTVERVPVTEIQREKTGEIKIKVKAYMTKPADINFDFMEKWNKNIPMPLREMTGIKIKETRGMVYMKLHGMAEPIIRCMRCGKTLTNPVSRKYGIGPECMSKLGLVFAIDDVDNISKALAEVTWEGWIIKSAIEEEVEV